MASVHKRKWKSPDGGQNEAWVVRYIDATGANRQRTFKKKKEADGFRAKAENELQVGSHVARTQTVTVAKLIETYLEAVDQRRKDGRRMGESYQRIIHMMLRVHVLPYLSAVLLAELDFNTVDRWARALSKNPKLSPTTTRRVMHIFKLAVDFGIRRGWAHRNTITEVMKEYRGVRSKTIRTFAKDEVQRLLVACNEKVPEITPRGLLFVRCYVYLAALCGLRMGEIGGLRVEHIDFERGVLQVRHSLTNWDELKSPKTRAGVRDVPLPPIVAIELQAWLRSYYQHNDRGLVFRTARGTFVGAENFHANFWRPLLDRAGLGPDVAGTRFRFHALRHFCASLMIDQGVPLADAAELLGHSSFDMTLQVYTHTIASGQRRRDVLDRMSSLMLPAPNFAPAHA